MKGSSLLIGALVLTLLNVAPARGGVMFDDFGPAGSYDRGSGWIVSGPDGIFGQYASAQAFSPVISGTVDEVRFAAALDPSEGGANRIVFNLMSDDGGTPGIVLESYTFVDQMGFAGQPNPPLVAISSLRPFLSAGARYWMVAVAEADTFATWASNDQGVANPVLYSDDGGSNWYPDGPGDSAAFAVIGTAVPEPSSVAMLGTAIVVGGCACRRRWARRPLLG